MEATAFPELSQTVLVLVFLLIAGLLVLLTMLFAKQEKSKRPIFVSLLLVALWVAYLYVLLTNVL